jgi:hypothetical protein
MIQCRDEPERHAGGARPDRDATGIDAERIGPLLDGVEHLVDLANDRPDLRPPLGGPMVEGDGGHAVGSSQCAP